MSAARAPSAGKLYGVARVCRVWKIPRTSLYAARKRQATDGATNARLKRGPKTLLSDQDVADQIREIQLATERDLGWHGEGYRKAWARLQSRGVRISKRRVLRVMRVHGLLAPSRTGAPRGPRAHVGQIVTDRPDGSWGMDGTTTLAVQQGSVWVFAAIDPFTGECLGVYASLHGDRFEALQSIFQAVAATFKKVETGSAAGLRFRHDRGFQYTSRDFQREIAWLGIESSPSFLRAPEGNGIAERFFRTLKEQLLRVQAFQDVQQLFTAIQDFRRRDNVPGSSPATAASRPASAAASSSLRAGLRPNTTSQQEISWVQRTGTSTR
jgi:putative transposase